MSEQKRRLVREYYENTDGTSSGRRLVREYYEDVDAPIRGRDVEDGEFFDDDEEDVSYSSARQDSYDNTHRDSYANARQDSYGDSPSGKSRWVDPNADAAPRRAATRVSESARDDYYDSDDAEDYEEDTDDRRGRKSRGRRKSRKDKNGRKGKCGKCIIIAVVVVVLALVLLFACSASGPSIGDSVATDNGVIKGSLDAGQPDDEYTALVDAWNVASYKIYRKEYSPNSYITNDPDDSGEADRTQRVDNTSLPSKFDLRDYGYVTPVKKQSPWGSCWSFADIGAAETSILSESGQTYEETGLDLSELQVAWFAYSLAPDAAGDAAGEGIFYYNEAATPNIRMDAGGSMSQAISLFSSGCGPASEELIPYKNAEDAIQAYAFLPGDDDSFDIDMTEQDLELLEANGVAVTRSNYAKKYQTLEDFRNDVDPTDATWAVDLDLWGESEYALENGNLLPEYHVLDSDKNYVRTDEEAIKATKRELYAGHGVAVGILADISSPGSDVDTTWYDQEHNALYVKEVQSTDHAVLIVGWDDTYSRYNFGEGDSSKQPPADGAWIIKNSWGAGTEEFPNSGSYGIRNEDGVSTGYFYVSYYDQSIEGPTTYDFDLDAPDSDDTYIYQYTYCVSSDLPNILTTTDKSAQANVFKAHKDTTLYAVSAETAHTNIDLTIDVYLLNGDATSPTDGTLAASVTQNYEFAGYHRIALDEDQYVDLPEGQRFSIVVTQYCPDNGLYYQNADRSYNSNADEEAATNEYFDKLYNQYYNDAYASYYKMYQEQGMSDEEAAAAAEKDATNYVDSEDVQIEISDLAVAQSNPWKSLITQLVIEEGQSYVLNGDTWSDWSVIAERLTELSGDIHEVYDNFAIKGYSFTN